MPAETAICNVFRRQLLLGAHNLDADTLRFALFNSGTLDRTARSYEALRQQGGEVTAIGYAAGGYELTAAVSDDGPAVDVADLNVPNLIEHSIRGGLVYNSTLQGDNAIAVFDLRNATVNGAITFSFSDHPFIQI